MGRNFDDQSSVKKNFVYAFAAQAISLVGSILFSLIVPKVLVEDQFAYWQLFLFYSGYVGFFQLGLQDGLYLRLGGQKHSELNRPLISSQLKYSTLIQTLMGVLLSLSASLILDDKSRKFVIALTMIYMVVSSIAGFIGYIFQAVNMTEIFSRSAILERVSFLSMILVLVFFKVKTFEIYIIAFIVAKCIQMVYSLFVGRGFIFIKGTPFKTTFAEMKINLKVGIKLVIANITSILILGISRILTDQAWGIERFSKLSFSLTLTSFFLTFITQISMVLFPALRRMNKEKINEFYLQARDILAIIAPAIYAAYVPICVILGLWLPNYKDSLFYLGFLLPISVYDGKMNMLCNTYFKVLRKEAFLLGVNVITLIVSSVLSLISVYVLNDILAVVFTMVFSIMLRSVISEIYLSKLMNKKILSTLVQELILTVVFVFTAWKCSYLLAFIIYASLYLVYLIINRKKIVELFLLIKSKLIKNK